MKNQPHKSAPSISGSLALLAHGCRMGWIFRQRKTRTMFSALKSFFVKKRVPYVRPTEEVILNRWAHAMLIMRGHFLMSGSAEAFNKIVSVSRREKYWWPFMRAFLHGTVFSHFCTRQYFPRAYSMQLILKMADRAYEDEDPMACEWLKDLLEMADEEEVARTAIEVFRAVFDHNNEHTSEVGVISCAAVYDLQFTVMTLICAIFEDFEVAAKWKEGHKRMKETFNDPLKGAKL